MVSIADVDRFRQRLDELASNLIARSAVSNWSELIEKVVLAPGLLEVTLNEQAIANYLKLDTDRLASDALQIIAPFQLRRRGVETRIILGVPRLRQMKPCVATLPTGSNGSAPFGTARPLKRSHCGRKVQCVGFRQ